MYMGNLLQDNTYVERTNEDHFQRIEPAGPSDTLSQKYVEEIFVKQQKKKKIEFC